MTSASGSGSPRTGLVSLLGGGGESDQGEGCSMSSGVSSSTDSGSVAMSSADNVPLDWKLYHAPTHYCRTHADVDYFIP